MVTPTDIDKALKAAISAIYFDDSSDYETALYQVVKHLAGEVGVTLLESNPAEAYNLYVRDMLSVVEAPVVKAGKCAHKNRECVYESDDGEFEKWVCKDCGKRWGVEIAQ